MALVAAFFTLTLASCSKDDVSSDIDDPVVSPPADSEAPSYYAITDAEGIGFTKDGIAYEYISNGKTRWVLSYQEIAKRLDIDISKIFNHQDYQRPDFEKRSLALRRALRRTAGGHSVCY
nr:hypothetical protein [Prevotella sp.]